MQDVSQSQDDEGGAMGCFVEDAMNALDSREGGTDLGMLASAVTVLLLSGVRAAMNRPDSGLLLAVGLGLAVVPIARAAWWVARWLWVNRDVPVATIERPR